MSRKRPRPEIKPIVEPPAEVGESPAYRAVFREIDEFARQWFRGKSCLGLLIEEYANATDAHFKGEPLRIWHMDRQHIRSITSGERRDLGRHNRGVVYRLPVIQFGVGADGTRVHYAVIAASTAGHGGVYTIGKKRGKPILVPDMNGGFWRS